MKLDGEIAHFNIFDEMKHHVNSHSIFAIHVVNPTVQEFSEFNCRGKLKVVANKHHELKATYDVKVGRKLKRMVALNGDLDHGGMPLIGRKFELQPN